MNWDLDSGRLGIGDEFDADRQWHGVIYWVAVFSQALVHDDIQSFLELL